MPKAKMIPSKSEFHVFDLDGTTVDSMKHWAIILMEILNKSGIDYPEDIMKTVSPLGCRGAVEYFKGMGVRYSVDYMVEWAMKYMKNAYKTLVRSKDGVNEYIEKLFLDGKKIYILTACPHPMCEWCLENNGLLNMLTEVITCEDMGCKKSEPEMYEKLINRIGCKPEQIVFYDDNIISLKTAKKFGINTVGVYDEYSGCDAKSMISENDVYIKSFTDFLYSGGKNMIINNVSVHNADYCEKDEHGYKICRFPKEVYDCISSEQGKNAAMSCTGVEFRFVINSGDSATLNFYLETEGNTATATAMYHIGSFQCGWLWLSPYYLREGYNKIEIKLPPNYQRLCEIEKEQGLPFSTNVVRLNIGSTKEIRFIDAVGDIRPPKPEELPKEYAVFYGSSITHGSLSLNNYANYVSLVSKRLKIDWYNKGMAGSCFLEPEVIDNVMSYTDAKFIVAEIATNSHNKYEFEELKRRTEYLINKFVETNTDRHLFVIDILLVGDKYDATRKMVEEAVKNANCDKIHLVSGKKLVPDLTYVSADNVHPTIDGHINIADGLYNEIIKYVK